MLGNFIKFADQEKLHEMDDRTLLGVSGGLDSMVMANLYIKAGFSIGIAHCNFKLRGQESDDDEQFVAQYADEQKIPFYSIQFETEHHASNQNLSIQMAARELRMNWFFKLLSGEGFDTVATAHHKDDQIETFFINLLRGTGISGLRGILPRSGKLIHPLLFANRKEIRDYAIASRISYREDSSNLKINYIRNKIRHLIIPELEQIKPGFANILADNMDHLRSAEQILKIHLDNTWDSLTKEENGLIKINLKKLRILQELPTYLFEYLKHYGFNSSDASLIARSINNHPGKQFFSKTHRVLLDRDFLILEDVKDNDNQNEFLILEDDGKIYNPVELCLYKFKKEDGFKINSDPNIAQLDADYIKFPLKIRKWEKGDKFHPLGMTGNKLISDFFIDKKFSQIEKENTWLLLSGGQILWIIGVQIDDRYKILTSTKHVMELKYSTSP